MINVNTVLLAVFTLFFLTNLEAQIGIGTTTPDPSAIVDISSTEGGLLIPRLSQIEIDNISNPSKGLMLYNLDENCIQINFGSSTTPDWLCLGVSPVSRVEIDCALNGFEGNYVVGSILDASHKFTIAIINNTPNSTPLNFNADDLVLSGYSGVTVTNAVPDMASVNSGDTLFVEYVLSGNLTSAGSITAEWTNPDLSVSCTRSVNIITGDATFSIPAMVDVFSMSDFGLGVQGEISNGSPLTINIPYTDGFGTYEADTLTFIDNDASTGELGDVNGFRLIFPSGTFSSTGNIVATVEVNGDGLFLAKRLPSNSRETIVELGFSLNGINKGQIKLDIVSGIPDKKYGMVNHNFIYTPVTVDIGGGLTQTWLNNNLGANYSNANHLEFNPVKQATAFNDFNAYGSLFQWGRDADGHELINSTDSTISTVVNDSTHTLSNSDTPANSLFIASTTGDWRETQNNDLWQGESGTNNPCPNGYRLPTNDEVDVLISALNLTTGNDAANSPLAFTATGIRNGNSANLALVGTGGFYRTSSIVGGSVGFYSMQGGSIGTFFTPIRSDGFAVRCIKD